MDLTDEVKEWAAIQLAISIWLRKRGDGKFF
jgi:hypothetical protein